jgi:hypothetical protein
MHHVVADDEEIIGQTKRYLGDGSVWEVVDVNSNQTVKAKCIESTDASEEGDTREISRVIWNSGMYNPDQT